MRRKVERISAQPERTIVNKILRRIQNVLLVILLFVALRLVWWVQEYNYQLGYALGIGVVGLALWIVIERYNPRR